MITGCADPGKQCSHADLRWIAAGGDIKVALNFGPRIKTHKDQAAASIVNELIRENIQPFACQRPLVVSFN